MRWLRRAFPAQPPNPPPLRLSDVDVERMALALIGARVHGERDLYRSMIDEVGPADVRRLLSCTIGLVAAIVRHSDTSGKMPVSTVLARLNAVVDQRDPRGAW